MNIFVDSARFLSVPCDAEERIVFDRPIGKYHLLRESAAKLWEQIEGGGTFELDAAHTSGEDNPVRILEEAGLLSILETNGGRA